MISTLKLLPTSYAVSSSTSLLVTNASNMYADVDSTTAGTVRNASARASGTFALKFPTLTTVPKHIKSITAKIKCSSSSYLATDYVYLRSNGGGATARSLGFVNRPFNSTNVKVLQVDSENFYYFGTSTYWDMTISSSSTTVTANMNIYGASLEIEYYDENVFVKEDDEWCVVGDAYEKVNGVWVYKPDERTIFTSDKRYQKGEL